MLSPPPPASRRGVLSMSLALAAGAATLASGLAPRKVRAAGAAPEGFDKLRETTPPRPLPEIAFTDAEGTPQGIARFAGQGVLINLWATWCPPCVAEMPALESAAVPGPAAARFSEASLTGGRDRSCPSRTSWRGA